VVVVAEEGGREGQEGREVRKVRKAGRRSLL